jgi:hypothetical protein
VLIDQPSDKEADFFVWGAKSVVGFNCLAVKIVDLLLERENWRLEAEFWQLERGN